MIKNKKMRKNLKPRLKKRSSDLPTKRKCKSYSKLNITFLSNFNLKFKPEIMAEEIDENEE